MKRAAPFETLPRRGQIQRIAHRVREAYRDHGLAAPRLRTIQYTNNLTFRADFPDGACEFLRLSKTSNRSVDALTEEIAWLMEVGKLELPVIQAIPWDSSHQPALLGDVDLGGERVLSRFRWLEGAKKKSADATQSRWMGEAMALLHNHAQPYREGSHRWRVDEMTGNRSDAATVHADLETLFGIEVRRRMHHIELAVLEMRDGLGGDCLIHGDLHVENVLFTKEGLVVVDFDDCGWASLSYDLCVPIREFRVYGNGNEEAFLEGYESVRPLPVSARDPGVLSTLLDLRGWQLVLWVIENRDHVDFRTWWQEEVEEILKTLMA
jgi:Ser/Thr protein kinase RdoA (MazF antagonist)